MTNMRLINEAIKLATDYFEANFITVDTAAIENRVKTWYNKTEIVEAEMLAAAAIHSEYLPCITWKELLELKEFYFPTNPEEFIQKNFSIQEIEEALHDVNYLFEREV